MLGLLKCKRQPIALDIGTDSIKMLQMQRIDSVATAVAGGHWRFPDTNMDPKHRKALAVGAVREMLKKGQFKGRRVVSVLHSSQLHIKNVRLPHMSPAEMAEALQWEAKERFEFELPKGRIPYINAGEVRQGAETRDEIILIAVPQQVIDEHLEILDEIGLQPDHIDPEPIAIFRTFERFLRRSKDEQTVSIIIEIGYSSTRVVVARGPQILFLKTIDIGGRRFNEVVANHLNLSFEEAYELRLQMMNESASRGRNEITENTMPQTGSTQWSVYDAVRGEVESLAKEIALCIRYCSVTFRGLRCTTATVTGGEAYDPAVCELLSRHLGMPIEVGQPMKGFGIGSLQLGNRRGMLAEWTVCAGLAIRGMEPEPAKKDGDDGESRLSA